eukprot:gene898-10652_t
MDEYEIESSLVKTSKPKEVESFEKQTEEELHCFTDVPVGTLMNSCGNHIAASCKFVGFNCELGGGHGIGIVGLEDYGRQNRSSMPIIHGHADFVSDMCFSPFDDCLLATGAFDGEIKLWKIPDTGLDEILNNPALHLPSSTHRIDNVLFHPAAENVLAVTSNHSVKIYDLVGCNLHYDIKNMADDLPFQSMDWKMDGSLLVTSCKDTNLRIIDPRNSSISAEAKGHEGVKDSKAVWLGNTDCILSTGFGKTRQRLIGIWDTRMFTSSVAEEVVDNNAGILMPFYDVDTNMLLLAGKGDNIINFYEVTSEAKGLTRSSSDSLDTQTIGMARVPKRALHLMEAEVNRLMQLTKNAIIPISFVVPRRSYLDFHAELYPDTASGVPSMTAEQWFAGANHPVSLVKLDPKNVAKRSLPKAAGVKAEPSKTEEKSQEEAETKTAQVPEVVNKAEDPPKKVEAPKEDSTKAVPAPSKISNEPTPKPAEHKPKVSKFHGFRVSKFKHLSGKPSTKSQNIENLKNYDQSLCHESDGLQAYFDLVAYPIAGPGGQIAVVKGLLATASYDLDVKLWDVETARELITLQQHPEPVSGLSWHPDGHLIATISKDTKIRVFDPRTSTKPLQIGDGPDSPKGARIIWCGPNNQWLAVSGFSKLGSRIINLYDSKDLSAPIGNVELEPSPATLMLFYDEDSSTLFATGKGDRTLLAFEVSTDSPHIFALSPYNGAHQHQGIAFLRKDICNVREIEFARIVRITYSTMEQVSFTIPRVKKNFFQDDVFPPTRVKWQPSMSVDEWMGGANTPQERLDLRPSDMEPLHAAPKTESKSSKFSSSQRTVEAKSVKDKKDDLMTQMGGKFEDLADKPLEQDAMEGVEDHEWGTLARAGSPSCP